MPGTAEPQTSTAPPRPDTSASYGVPSPGATPAPVPMVQRDMAGNVIERAPQERSSDACSRGTAHTHAPGVPLCGAQPIPDPVNLAPIIVGVVSAILLIFGGLIYYEKGPAHLIRPKRRRKGATLRATRMRRRVGTIMVVVGVLGLARVFL